MSSFHEYICKCLLVAPTTEEVLGRLAQLTECTATQCFLPGEHDAHLMGNPDAPHANASAFSVEALLLAWWVMLASMYLAWNAALPGRLVLEHAKELRRC